MESSEGVGGVEFSMGSWKKRERVPEKSVTRVDIGIVDALNHGILRIVNGMHLN